MRHMRLLTPEIAMYKERISKQTLLSESRVEGALLEALYTHVASLALHFGPFNRFPGHGSSAACGTAACHGLRPAACWANGLAPACDLGGLLALDGLQVDTR